MIDVGKSKKKESQRRGSCANNSNGLARIKADYSDIEELNTEGEEEGTKVFRWPEVTSRTEKRFKVRH